MIGNFALTNVLGLAILALVSGIVSGMMTMGGGLIQVSGMMMIFGYGLVLVRPVVYLTNIFVFAASAYKNKKIGHLNWDNFISLIPWIIAGVIIGYIMGNELGDEHIAILVSIMAFVLGVKTIFEIIKGTEEEKTARELKNVNVFDVAKIKAELNDITVQMEEQKKMNDRDEEQLSTKHGQSLKLLRQIKLMNFKEGLLSFPVGLVSGILGIPGGVIGVPLQQHLYKLSLHKAIVNATFMGLIASFTGLIIALSHGMTTGLLNWQTVFSIAIIMIPGAYLGGIIGTKLLHVVSFQVLRWTYAIIMMLIAVKMIF